MIATSVVLLATFCAAYSFEYYGNSAGSLFGAGVKADVYLVNSTHLQVTNLHITSNNIPSSPFVLISPNGQRTSPKIFQYMVSPDGHWLRKLESLGREQRTGGTRYVLDLTGSAGVWKQFAIIDTNGNVAAAVNLQDKKPPRPFCCFEREDNIGLFGEYGIISEPIAVLDSRTLRIPRFSYKATETPDGFFYAGAGPEIDQKTGKKAMIVGRDTPNHICPMLADISDREMIVRLDESQTIYDIEWLSVFCYQYSHDFGHLDLGLVEDEELVPPYIPDIRMTAPPRLPQRKC